MDFFFANPRDMTTDPHHTVDDRPYGGGPGMVLMLEPLVALLRSLPPERRGRMLALTPGGRPFTQNMARELAREPALTLICGRYEGFDARLFDILPIEPVCVGDAVLNGGEAAALAVIEATARLQPGFMGKDASGDEESFSNGLLEYPHFTRPEEFEGRAVRRNFVPAIMGALPRGGGGSRCWPRSAGARSFWTMPRSLRRTEDFWRPGTDFGREKTCISPCCIIPCC